MSEGQDRTLVYMRQEKLVENAGLGIICKAVGRYRPPRPINPRLDVRDFIVGFCGKIYPVLRLSKSDWNHPDDKVHKVCFKMDDVDEFINVHFKEGQIEAYNQKKWAFSIRNWRWDHNRKNFTEFFEECAQKQDAFKNRFEDNHSPIFVANIEERTITYNACLKDLVEFYRVFDPYKAFQEISMFLGGLAVPQKAMPPITDEVMAEIKGFDRFSFRKPKSK